MLLRLVSLFSDGRQNHWTELAFPENFIIPCRPNKKICVFKVTLPTSLLWCFHVLMFSQEKKVIKKVLLGPNYLC